MSGHHECEQTIVMCRCTSCLVQNSSLDVTFISCCGLALWYTDPYKHNYDLS